MIPFDVFIYHTYKYLNSYMYTQVKTCDMCQRGNRKMAQTYSELHPIPVKSPWYHIGIDFIGPITTSNNGNNLILTISDYCTKWVEAVAMNNKSTSLTAASLFKVGYYGL